MVFCGIFPMQLKIRTVFSFSQNNAKGAETVGYSKILMISPMGKWVNFLGKFTNAKGAETVGRKLQTDVN